MKINININNVNKNNNLKIRTLIIFDKKNLYDN